MPKPYSNTATMADDWLGALDTSALLPEARPVRMALTALGLLTLIVLLFLIWAGIAEMKEVTAAYGQILPSGHVQTVQHLEGGIIKQILVKEGDRVKEGQPLVIMESAEAISNLNQAIYQRLLLLLEAERYTALLENREPNFTSIAQDDQTAIARQKEAFANMRQSREQERNVITQQISQYKDALKGLQSKQAILARNLKLNEEEYTMTEKLFNEGYLSKVKYLEKMKELNALRGDDDMTNLEIDRARGEIAEYQSRLSTLAAHQSEEAHQELSRLQIEIAKSDETVAKYTDRVTRLDVLSPIEGTVKGIEINTIGGVVAPGQKLMEIVPFDEELKVEANVRPSDIGQVKVGQDVKVKVHAFDYTHFGAIDGKLESVSATTFVGPNNTTYYKAIVKLDKQHAGTKDHMNMLVPGMTVDAEIVIGQRTLLAYLLKPIRNAADTAFTEK